MTDVFMYANETGNLDYIEQPGSSRFFGVGTAVLVGDHGPALGAGLRLRAELESAGVSLRDGFHAKNDSHATRKQVYDLIRTHAPRFDTTFLCKPNAYPIVRDRGQVYLFKMGWVGHVARFLPEQVLFRVASRRVPDVPAFQASGSPVIYCVNVRCDGAEWMVS